MANGRIFVIAYTSGSKSHGAYTIYIDNQLMASGERSTRRRAGRAAITHLKRIQRGIDQALKNIK